MSASAVRLALLLAVVVARPAAGRVAGGGPEDTDCQVEFEGIASSETVCTDCDPSCDVDASAGADGRCTFAVSLCPNQPGCPGPLTRLKVRPRGLLDPLPDLAASACGASTTVVVGTRKQGRKAGTKRIKVTAVVAGRPPRVDRDVLTLTCQPRSGTCPAIVTTTTTTKTTTSSTAPTSTSSTVPTSTSTTIPGATSSTLPATTSTTAPLGTSSTSLPSTSSTTSTTTSSTTSSTGPCSCCAFSGVSFLTQVGVGACGTVRNSAGDLLGALDCGGFYLGGSQSTVQVPVSIPDMGETQATIATCDPETGDVVLAARSSAVTGSTRTCSTAGCFLGPPVPIPNPNVASLSACLVNKFSADASGTLNCQTGAASLAFDLSADAYLAGDSLAKRCSGGPNPGGACTSDAACAPGGTCASDPTVQPCPLCNPDTLLCNGGANDGQACMPGSGSGDPTFPTSQDCPPFSFQLAGSVPLAFHLTTGTVTWTSANGTGGSTQTRVFAGFCRDVLDGVGDPGTLAFEDPPRPCLENLVPGLACSQPFEACEQRSNGAFKFAAARTVVTTGVVVDGCLADAGGHSGTLAGIFAVPPTFNASMDGAANLPGPGAVSLPSTIQLLP